MPEPEEKRDFKVWRAQSCVSLVAWTQRMWAVCIMRHIFGLWLQLTAYCFTEIVELSKFRWK